MLTTSKSRSIRWVAVASAGLLWLGLCREGNATEIVSPANVNGDANPFILLNQTGGMGGPTRQWTLEGNHDEFSIRDLTAGQYPLQINSGSLSNSIRIARLGQNRLIGFGTSTPQRNLHIAVTTGTPTIRFQNSNQNWDIEADDLGFDLVSNPDGANTRPLTVLPDAPTASLFIGTTGHIGLGTATPSQRLSVAGNMELGVGATLSVISLRSTAGSNRIGNDATGLFVASDVSGKRMRFFTNAGAGILERLTILANGNVGIQQTNPTAKLQVGNAKCDGNTWIDVSSRDLKQNIRPLSTEEASEALRALNAVTFAYNSDPKEQCVGFIAEDVPALVARNDRRTLHSMDLVGVLAKVAQDQERQLADERQRNDQQQTSLERQRKTLDEQRQLIAQQQTLLATLSRRMLALEQQAGGTVDLAP